MGDRSSALQRELRQTRPFRSPGHEAAVGLLHTADVLRRYVNRVLEPYGITHPQYNVLRILRGAGPEGLPTLEVAERLVERTPGITRMMDRLEKRGWVRRERSADDRREVRCYLTAKGGELLHELDEPINETDIRTVAPLTPSDQRRLIGLLDAIRGGLE